MAGFRIRESIRSDFPTLLSIDQECFAQKIAYDAEELTYFMNRPHSRTFVAEVDRRIVGFLLNDIEALDGHPPIATLVTLDVLEFMRRIGIGAALLDHSERTLRGRGVSRYRLQVDVSNSTAIGFYRRSGFLMLKTLKGYYGDGADAFLMEKMLL